MNSQDPHRVLESEVDTGDEEPSITQATIHLITKGLRRIADLAMM
jgi:hypothetical protein